MLVAWNNMGGQVQHITSSFILWLILTVTNYILLLHQIQGLECLLKTNLEDGINGEDADVVKRKSFFGANTYPAEKSKSFLVSVVTIVKFERRMDLINTPLIKCSYCLYFTTSTLFVL